MKELMFQEAADVQLKTFAPTENTEFSINTENSGIIIRSLTKSLYANPLYAVIRELLSNAVDSTRKAGNNKIFINIPRNDCYSYTSQGTDMSAETAQKSRDILLDILRGFDGTQKAIESGDKSVGIIDYNEDTDLVIRDFGTGIKPEEFGPLYTSLFTSTKRGDSESIGHYGLGSKSPFALADTFVAINYYDGVRYEYQAGLMDTAATLMLISETPTSEPNGLCVVVTARETKPKYYSESGSKAISLFTDIEFVFSYGDEVSASNLLQSQGLVKNSYMIGATCVSVEDDNSHSAAGFNTSSYRLYDGVSVSGVFYDTSNVSISDGYNKTDLDGHVTRSQVYNAIFDNYVKLGNTYADLVATYSDGTIYSKMMDALVFAYETHTANLPDKHSNFNAKYPTDVTYTSALHEYLREMANFYISTVLTAKHLVCVADVIAQHETVESVLIPPSRDTVTINVKHGTDIQQVLDEVVYQPLFMHCAEQLDNFIGELLNGAYKHD